MRKSIISAVFAALICAGWMMAIPVGPIPIVLQNALAVLAGLLQGPLFGGLSVLLFLIAGAAADRRFFSWLPRGGGCRRLDYEAFPARTTAAACMRYHCRSGAFEFPFHLCFRASLV